MNLQRKALLLVAVTIGVLTLSSAFVSRQSVSASFSDLERKQAKVEAARAGRILNQQLADLTATLMDYAYWDDTVEFVQEGMPEYMSDNFAAENMKFLRISKVLVLDAKGQLLKGTNLSEAETLTPVDPAMVQTVQQLATSVLSDARSETVIRTYHRAGDTLYLVGVAAIRSQFKPGTAPHGAMVMVRNFDASELTRFSDIVMHPVELTLPTAAATLPPELSEDDVAQRLLARTPITDQSGQVIAQLTLSLPRDLAAQGRALAIAAAAQVAVAALVVGALFLFLIDHLFLRRLARMHRELAAISARGLDGNARLSLTGADELTDVGEGVNALLDRVRADSARQIESHARQEALQLQLLQSQKTEALGRFAGGIAHDFNNSLAAVAGWVFLAKEDLAPEHPSRPSLDKALESLRYGKGLMRQLLSYGRQAPPRIERFRLGALVNETCELVSMGLLRNCRIQMDLQCPDDWVQADPTQLKQVIINLLINACDAMDGKGRITLTLGTRQLPSANGDLMPVNLAPGRYLCLTVGDDGPGIAPDHLSRVFEPFFTTKSQDKGTGLGLSVVQGIIARHHGAISVSNAPGAGACFEVLLPASAEAGGLPLPAPAPVRSGQRHLLYAEDDERVRVAWSTLLQRQGWVVTPASDGEEAWSRYLGNPGQWDLVLTDFSMPRLNGLQLAQRIRGTPAPPPMVLISAHASDMEALRMDDVGFAAVVQKPVESEDLFKLLNEVVEGRAPA